MNKDIVKEIIEIVESIERGEGGYDKVQELIKKTEEALINGDIKRSFALEVDERVGLEYF